MAVVTIALLLTSDEASALMALVAEHEIDKPILRDLKEQLFRLLIPADD